MTTVPPPVALTPFLTDAHRQLWADVDEFAATEIAPRVEQMENAPGEIERAVPQLLAERGWFGVTLPEGTGMGAGHVAKTVITHRLARVSGTAAAIYQAGLIPIGALHHYARGRAQLQLLSAAARGEAMLSIAVTEPDHGGHIGGIQTTAEHRRQHWLLTGTKTAVGNSHLAGHHIVIARTAGPDAPVRQALTAFIVPTQRAGLTLASHRPALGLRGFSFGEIHLDRARVPRSHILGEIGDGHAIAQSSSILYGRPNLTALDLGLHEAAVDLTTRFTADRPRYGGRLADVGVVRDRLGQMTAHLHTATLLAYHAAHLLDRGLPCDPQLITAKLTGHELAAASGRTALELHASHGLGTDYPLERVWRDLQCTYAPAGTGEIQRLRLAQAATEAQDAIPHPQWSELFADRVRHRPPWPATA